jgi:hypothetical protein
MISDSTPSTPDLAAKYSPGQADVLTQLRAEQARLGLSDGAFVQRHLTVSATVWNRLCNGTYPANPAAAFVKLEGNLRQLRLERTKAARLTGGRKFIALPKHQAVHDAVTSAKLKEADDQDRLVVFLAESGGGKTALARDLMLQHDGILVEARESWRDSYYAAARDIATAAEVSASELDQGKHAAETALLRRLRANRRVLIIDEAEYFGPRTANLIKLILNQTETVVVLLAIPVLFRRWQEKAWVESVQLNRRAVTVVGDVVTNGDVRKFVDADGRVKLEPGEALAACNAIAEAANAFGRYDTVKRVIDDLAEEEAGEPVGLKAAAGAVLRVKVLLNRHAR